MMLQAQSTVARLVGVTRRYGALRALDAVDLGVARGEVLALLGPNGAGKTTAVSLLLGLQTPDAGHAELFGQAPTSLAARRRIGAMLQATTLPDTLTVRELIVSFRGYYLSNPGRAARSIADAVALTGVEPLLHSRYGKLSGGQQRRVQFALAIVGDPEILFLDEPTTGLDVEARAILWRTIRELVARGCAVVLTTHYLEEAEALADRVAVLARGRIIAQGSVAQINARVSARRIRCVSALEPQRVAQWAGVRSAQVQGRRLELLADDAEGVLRRLLAEDAGVSDLEVSRAGLAEAFVEITREAA